MLVEEGTEGGADDPIVVNGGMGEGVGIGVGYPAGTIGGYDCPGLSASFWTAPLSAEGVGTEPAVSNRSGV